MSAPAPGSPEWMKFVTASKVAAILGLSPYDSPLSVWLAMKGRYDKPQTDVMKRGHYLEAGCLAWWRDQHPEAINYGEQGWTELDGWMAATPDACALVDGVSSVVDAKTSANDDEWDNDESGASIDGVPIGYWVQMQWQMIVTGARRAYIAKLGSRLVFSEYVIEYDATEADRLVQACRNFYDSLAADEPPALDGHPSTFKAIKAVNPDIEKGEAVELDWDDALLYLSATRDIKEATAQDLLQKSALLNLMGRAQYATHGGATIARRQANRNGISLVPVATLSTLDNLAQQEIA